MTIKELEERTGMPRANIRFYEDEGLLNPKRLPNGYRDYSEEDVLTLEKIKLLRQLQLDIGTIRLVQEGKLTLEQAMFSQLNRLEGDRAMIERAAEVCRGIERSGVEYGALDPKAWLKELEAPKKVAVSIPPPTPEPKPEPTELELHYWTHRACHHPWMRLFARGFDYSLCSAAFLALFLLVFRWHWYLDLGWFLQTLFQTGIYCVSILLEPLWLHYVGWTPGKWIFGLKVRDKNGEKLSLAAARSRAWNVALHGDGLRIPIFCLWRNWKAYRVCRDGEDCWWDVYENCMYTREDRKLYGLWWGAGLAVYGALVLLIIFGSVVPPHLNGLTVREFARNYNDRLAVYEQSYWSNLGDDGHWEQDGYPEESGYSSISINGGPTIEITGTTRWMDPQYTVVNGEVTAVTFVVVSDRTVISGGDYIPELFGFYAFTGALKGQNLFNYKVSEWEECWSAFIREYGKYWEDFDTVVNGIRVTQTVELEGYEPWEGVHMAAIGVENPQYVRTVTFSIPGVVQV